MRTLFLSFNILIFNSFIAASPIPMAISGGFYTPPTGTIYGATVALQILLHDLVNKRVVDKSRCSGVLISKDKVLTAAHCLDKLLFDSYSLPIAESPDNYSLEVRVGLSGKNVVGVDTTSPIWINVASFKNHPLYDKTNKQFRIHDLAIILLERPVHHVIPAKICILAPTDIDKGTRLVSYGFGVDETEMVSTRLKNADLNSLSKEEEIERMDSYIKSIAERSMAEIGSHHDRAIAFRLNLLKPTLYDDALLFEQFARTGFVMKGDSGGPIVLSRNSKDYVVGVLSRGNEVTYSSDLLNPTLSEARQLVFASSLALQENLDFLERNLNKDLSIQTECTSALN